MKQKTLNLLEEAISSAGRWIWSELTDDSIQLEFDNIQLYKPHIKKIIKKDNKENNKIFKHSSEITIRLANNAFFIIFYNNINDISFLESKKDFYHNISNEGLKFQNFRSFNEINERYKYNKEIIGSFNHSDNDVDFVLSIYFEHFALICGANQLDFFNDFESLNDEYIKKLSNQWWVYWVEYWKAKKLKKEYEYDPACEVFPIDINPID